MKIGDKYFLIRDNSGALQLYEVIVRGLDEAYGRARIEVVGAGTILTELIDNLYDTPANAINSYKSELLTQLKLIENKIQQVKDIDFADYTLNNLKAIKVLEERDSFGRRQVLCVCYCGKEFIAVLSYFNNNRVKSCGCSRFCDYSISSETLNCYRAMMSRCYNENHKFYHKYGGMGITVCDRWKESPKHFVEDMGERPGQEYSIERVNNKLGYEPGNCKWATRREQNENRSSSIRITHNGKTQSVRGWERELGFPRGMLYQRLKKMDFETAITLPRNYRNNNS